MAKKGFVVPVCSAAGFCSVLLFFLIAKTVIDYIANSSPSTLTALPPYRFKTAVVNSDGIPCFNIGRY